MYRERTALTGLDPATIAVRAGRPDRAGAPLNQPPVLASAFNAGDGPGYARRSNPTWEAFEQALGELEGGTAVSFATGMAAAAAIVETVPVGAAVAVADSAYVEVRALLRERAGQGLLRLQPFPVTDTEAALDAVGSSDVVWLDALANPSLDVPELDRILDRARRRGTLSVVDATVATPMLLRPLSLGADIVLHSATKYIGGHSDLLLGALVARDPRLAARLAERRTAVGAVPGTIETWLGLRGMRTLPVRIERGVATAGALAERLAADRRVHSVRYPGLPGDPTHRTASRLLDGYGAVISFRVADSGLAEAVCAAVEVITHAGSLGGVETLIERQARWHAEPAVPGDLLRLSVGCEDPGDLWRDLDRALSVCA